MRLKTRFKVYRIKNPFKDRNDLLHSYNNNIISYKIDIQGVYNIYIGNKIRD